MEINNTSTIILVDHILSQTAIVIEDYKGVFSEGAVGVFNGKIHVDRIAQKTNAFQQNNNILLDDKATVNTKPQLKYLQMTKQ